MSIFFIVCFIGLVVLGIWKGGVAVLGKGCMVVVIVLFFAYTCKQYVDEENESEARRKEYQEKADEAARQRHNRMVERNMREYGMPDPPDNPEEAAKARQWRKAHGLED